jgi:hypothetical protein
MNENKLRESLLRQNAASSVEAELQALHGLMDSEERRARRLTMWTLAVWASWFALVAAMFVLFLLLPLFVQPPAVQPPAAPVAQAANDQGIVSTAVAAILRTIVSLMLIAAVLLPAAGLILLILQILTRRSATLSQLRASIAAIEAQLKSLAAAPPAQPTQQKD